MVPKLFAKTCGSHVLTTVKFSAHGPTDQLIQLRLIFISVRLYFGPMSIAYKRALWLVWAIYMFSCCFL